MAKKKKVYQKKNLNFKFVIKSRGGWIFFFLKNSGSFGVIIHYKDIKYFFFYKIWDVLLLEKGKFWDNKGEELKKVLWILNIGEKWKLR